MIAQVVYLEVKAESLKSFLKEAAANAEESRREAGVIQFDLLQQGDDPTKFMLYEVYQDETALEAHRDTSHFKRWVEVGVPLLAKPRERLVYHFVNSQ